MPTVADYAVLRDESFELGPNETFETPPFFRPDGFVQGTNLARAIFAYICQPLEWPPLAPSVDFTIRHLSVPSQEIVRARGLSGYSPLGLWETFPATGFGQNVSTSFLITVSEGRARFSDIVLWYQVRV